MTNIHTELKPQLKVSHDMNFLAHYTPVPSPRGTLVGLAPPNKTPNPQI